MTINFETIQEIDLWVKENVVDCKLVGISEDGELFLEYQNPNEDLEIIVETKIREKFPKIYKFITVSRPSIQELEKTISELNKVLAGESKKPDLLQIEI